MSAAEADPCDFYNVRVPAHFNRTLAAQRASGESGAGLTQSMQSVAATICVVVEGDPGGTFFLNIAAGHMRSGSCSDHTPFVTLKHDARSFAVLERESGDSILGFLGGIAGVREEIKLTTRMVENFAALDGSLLIEILGESGFRLLSHFGAGPIPEQPKCALRLDEEAYAQLRCGALSPEDAFLGGRVQVEGDLEMAIGFGLAVVSPE
jgi:hypothetical protein